MAPKSRQLRVQEVLLAIGTQLHRGEFYTQEDLLETLAPHTDTDGGFALRIISASVSQGILGRTGKHYIFRRIPDHEDFVDICQEEGIELPPSSAALEPGIEELSRSIMNLPKLEGQLLNLQQSLEAMKTSNHQHHWLCIRFDRMPRDLRDALRAKAVQIVGSQAKPEELERHMTLVAAQVLLHAMRAKQKPSVRGIIPVDTGDSPDE